MTLTRSAGAHTDTSLRIELGGPENPLASLPAIAPRLLLDNQPLPIAGQHWTIIPWLLLTDDTQTIDAFLQIIQQGKQIHLRQGEQTISLQGLKAALLFIDAQQKRVGNESAWIGKGDERSRSVPPAPALNTVAIPDPTPTPLSDDEHKNLLNYATWRMNNSHCSLDLLLREVWVTALTDENALIIQSCESGAYNTFYLAWLVARRQPYVAQPIHLQLPFLPPGRDGRDIELVNLTFNEKSRDLTTLEKGRSSGDCGVQTRWRYDGQRFRLVRYAGQPVCDNWQGPDAWPTLWITR